LASSVAIGIWTAISVIEAMQKDEVIRLIDDRFQTVNGGINFEIIKDGVRQEESWWLVPVIATRRDGYGPRLVTIEIYANIETELEEKHDLTVLFVPAVSN
jgi:hypothetical protein